MPKTVSKPKSCNETCRKAILQATSVLLKDIGYKALTIEGIAAKAKVGKATIYRWWPSKGMLAVDAFLSTMNVKTSYPETASASADIIVQMKNLAKMYRGTAGKIMCEVVASAQHDAETRKAFYEGYLKPRRQNSRAVIQRGIDNKEFKKSTNVDAVIDALYSPIVWRILVGHGPVQDDFVEALVDTVLNGIRA